MITTTTICDKCGNVIPDDKQTWAVRIYYACGKDVYMGNTANSTRTVQWCRPCFESTGLVPRVETKTVEPPTTITLDEFVREIVRDETKNQ